MKRELGDSRTEQFKGQARITSKFSAPVKATPRLTPERGPFFAFQHSDYTTFNGVISNHYIRKGGDTLSMKEAYTIKEAAAAWGMGIEQIKRWIRGGKIRASKVGKYWIITHKEMDRLLAEHAVHVPRVR